MTVNAYAFCTVLIFAAFLLGLKLGLTLHARAEKKEAIRLAITNTIQE